MVYANDPKAIRDAQKELENQKYQAQIDALNKMVERLEKYKELWDKIPDSYEKAQRALVAADLFGPDWQDKILNLDMELYNNFTPAYADAEQNMRDAAAESAKALRDAADSLSTIAINIVNIDTIQSKHGYTLRDFEGQQIGFFESMEAAQETARALGGAAENWAIEEIDAIPEQIKELGNSLSALGDIDIAGINHNISETAKQYNLLGDAIPEGTVSWSYETDLDKVLGEIRGRADDGSVKLLKDTIQLLIDKPWDSDTWIRIIDEELSGGYGYMVTEEQATYLGGLLRNNTIQSTEDFIKYLSEALSYNSYQNDEPTYDISAVEKATELLKALKGDGSDTDVEKIMILLEKIPEYPNQLNTVISSIKRIMEESGFDVTNEQLDEFTGYLENVEVSNLEDVSELLIKALGLNEAQKNLNKSESEGAIAVDSMTQANDSYIQSLEMGYETKKNEIEYWDKLALDTDNVRKNLEEISKYSKDGDKYVSEDIANVATNFASGIADIISGKSQATGTAYANGKWDAGSKGVSGTETALVGELGKELVVHRNGTYETVGDNGAEFAKIKDSDIVFNHKQTKALLENGHINSRGKAYANGKFTPLSNLSGGNFDLYKSLNIIGENIPNIKTDLNKLVNKISSPNFVMGSGSANINISNVSFTCPGVTSEDVMKQISDSFTGLLNNAYQQIMK